MSVPHNFVKDRAMKRRIAEHHTKWRGVRHLRASMSDSERADEQARLQDEIQAFLARRDADSAHPN